MNSNPLSQYFRQPAIFVRLPSQGKFYPANAIEHTVNGEYPVLPMTTADEITYRTPDALFNGQAVCSVVESCVPNIKDAWAIPSIDLDTILVAIRIATYGSDLDINTTCPSCETESEYTSNLTQILSAISSVDYTKSLAIGDLEIWFQPLSYKQMNDNSLTQFEEQRSLQSLQDISGDNSEQIKQLSDVLKKINNITTRALAQSIALVKTPTAQVSEFDHIAEWLVNCDRKTFAEIRDYIIENKQKSELQPMHIQCSNCNHEYDQPFTLNMTDFFEGAS
jgi:rubredoxin